MSERLMKLRPLGFRVRLENGWTEGKGSLSFENAWEQKRVWQEMAQWGVGRQWWAGEKAGDKNEKRTDEGVNLKYTSGIEGNFQRY